MARRVIEEIDSHLRFRKPLDIALTVAFVVFYMKNTNFTQERRSSTNELLKLWKD